jgi:hypothetical protein
MSEVGWYKSRIRVAGAETYGSNIEENPSFEILRRAMETVAREHGGALADSISDYYGNKTPCDLAVTTSGFGRGVGVKVDRRSGAVTFVYDPYGGYKDVARGIAEEITQNYVSIGLIRAMKALGYQVQEEPSRKTKTIVLTGVL